MRAVGGYAQWVVWVYVIYIAIISFYLFCMTATLSTAISFKYICYNQSLKRMLYNENEEKYSLNDSLDNTI